MIETWLMMDHEAGLCTMAQVGSPKRPPVGSVTTVTKYVVRNVEFATLEEARDYDAACFWADEHYGKVQPPGTSGLAFALWALQNQTAIEDLFLVRSSI